MNKRHKNSNSLWNVWIKNISHWPRHESVTETRENKFCFDRTLWRFLVQPLLQTRGLKRWVSPSSGRVEAVPLTIVLGCGWVLICQTALGDERHRYGVLHKVTGRRICLQFRISEKSTLALKKKYIYFAFRVKTLQFEKYFLLHERQTHLMCKGLWWTQKWNRLKTIIDVWLLLYLNLTIEKKSCSDMWHPLNVNIFVQY